MTFRFSAWTIEWISVLYNEKGYKGRETGLKEIIIYSIWNLMSLNAGEILRWGCPVNY